MDVQSLFFFLFFLNELDTFPCAAHVTELELQFMFYSKGVTLPAHSTITKVISKDCRYYHLIWMAEYWLIWDIFIKTCPGLQSSTCLFNSHMLFIKSPFFVCQSYLTLAITQLGTWVITAPSWVFSISFRDEKYIILILHARMLSQITTQSVLIIKFMNMKSVLA